MSMNARTDANWVEKTKIFFAQVRTETSKVQWPTRDQVKTYVLVVLIGSAVSSILLGAWDWLLTEVIKIFFKSTV